MTSTELVDFNYFRNRLFNYKTYDNDDNPMGFPRGGEDRTGLSDIACHLPLLTFVASMCDTGAEFGVRDCFSTVALLSGLRLKLYSYDLQGSTNVNHLRSMKLPIDWEFHEQNTIREGFKIPPVDLLFVDSLHTFGQVRDELAMHGDNVKKFILFHDTSLYSQGVRSLDVSDQEGINRAISEYAESHGWTERYSVEFGHGLKILVRNQ